MKLFVGFVCGGLCLVGTSLAADPQPGRRALGALELDAITAGADAGAIGLAVALDPTFATTTTGVGATVATREYGGGYTGGSAAGGAVATAYTAGNGGTRGTAAGSSASTPEGPAGSSVIAINGAGSSHAASFAISGTHAHSVLWHGFK